MNTLMIAIGVFFGIFFLFQLILIWILITPSSKRVNLFSSASLPKVSILVAARNEEANILACLQALDKLHYPATHYEVWIGNDQSEDRTLELIEGFIRERKNFHVLTVHESWGTAHGKANVLAQLARKAQGDFFFITDADIQVPHTWVNELLAYHQSDIGIVSGLSMVKGTRYLHHMQTLDWVYAFGMVTAVSDRNIPVSAVGNNMMISRQAYESTGGYEVIPFSVIEDLQLFQYTLRKGWKFRNIMTPNALAISAPMNSLGELIGQRKRWIAGAMRIPKVLITFLGMQAALGPILILALILFPLPALSLWGVKFILQSVFMICCFKRIKQPVPNPLLMVMFEFYAAFLSLTVVVVHLLPSKIQWKGRLYTRE